MNAAFAIPIFFLLIPLTAILAVATIIIVAIRTAAGRRDTNRLSQDEEVQFHQLMAALQKMEERVVNLETILMQRQRRQDYPPSGEERR